MAALAVAEFGLSIETILPVPKLADWAKKGEALSFFVYPVKPLLVLKILISSSFSIGQ